MWGENAKGMTASVSESNVCLCMCECVSIRLSIWERFLFPENVRYYLVVLNYVRVTCPWTYTFIPTSKTSYTYAYIYTCTYMYVYGHVRLYACACVNVLKDEVSQNVPSSRKVNYLYVLAFSEMIKRRRRKLFAVF